MVMDIQSKEVIDKISEELKVQPAFDIPRGLSKDIQLVYGVNPLERTNVHRSNFRSSTGSITIFTVPTDRPFFLTQLILQNVSDATADNTLIVIAGTAFGEPLRNIIQITKLTTTAFDDNITLTFRNPMRMEPGSTLTLTNTFAAGASTSAGTVLGFTTDPQ